jgi:hypothetical protein
MSNSIAVPFSTTCSTYPLSTCIVRTKSKLGSISDPVQRVVGNRLVQFCCNSCAPKFDKNPAKYIAVLDAAWAERHRMRGNKEKGKAHGHEHGGKGHGEGEGHEGH